MQKLRFLLFPFSLVFICATEFRHLLFRIKLLKQKKFGVPVIVVGNLSTGGTGKSPMVDYLLKLLVRDGRPVSLSRGYGRKTKGFYEVSLNSSATDTGDEPLMLKSANPSTGVFVDENRVRGIERILKTNAATSCVILDDAFQHRYVKPSCAILLTQWSNPFYKDYVLPVGNLRELRKNANRADIVIMTKCPALTDDQMDEAVADVERYSNAKVFFSRLEYGKPIGVFDNKTLEEKPDEILLVTGIARAGFLLEYCKGLYSKVHHLEFSDHYVYKQSDFERIAENFNRFVAPKKAILTTHKDAVKWLGVVESKAIKPFPVFYQPINIKIIGKEKEFNDLMLKYARKAQ
ncbi:MAG TPA: tetraacyldisaccharide 4'-kinase [Flavobacteriales bacterium]|nr:tetraacyldisaccharide 4'-kinase [Flavobacteriales bacterium]